MFNTEIVFLNFLVFCVRYTVIFGYSTEMAIQFANYLPLSESNQRISRIRFKKDWLPVGFCKSGIPLLKSKFCNGKSDCKDGSDETTERCRNNSCKSDHFRCNYGGCISKIMLCNGAFECADGSDENQEICRATNCMIPYPSRDTVYYVLGCDKCHGGSRVKEGSVLSYQCLSNASQKVTSVDTICQIGIWSPAVPYCTGNKNVSSLSQKPTTIPNEKSSDNTPSDKDLSSTQVTTSEKLNSNSRTSTKLA